MLDAGYWKEKTKQMLHQRPVTSIKQLPSETENKNVKSFLCELLTWRSSRLRFRGNVRRGDLVARLEDSWYRRGRPLPTAIDIALGGLSVGWKAAVRVAEALAARQRLGVSVVGVNSLAVGGSGKTPVACWVSERLLEVGFKPALISRGYGGDQRGPLRVDPSVHSGKDVGDEPLWLAARLPEEIPVVVSRRRTTGCSAAVDEWNADVVVLDDALMLFSLKLDVEIMTVGSSGWLGNERCLPAGPLRMPISRLERSDLLFMVTEPGKQDKKREEAIIRAAGETPIFEASVFPTSVIAPNGDVLPLDFLGNRTVVLWSGIARWWRFLDLVRGLGADIRQFTHFPDHHDYSENDLAALAVAAEKSDAILLTTAKDAARWPEGADWRPHYLEIELQVGETDKVMALIVSKLSGETNVGM